jgi:hypothetical protein
LARLDFKMSFVVAVETVLETMETSGAEQEKNVVFMGDQAEVQIKRRVSIQVRLSALLLTGANGSTSGELNDTTTGHSHLFTLGHVGIMNQRHSLD